MDKDSWLLAGVLLFAGYGLARNLAAAKCTPMVSPGDKLFLLGDSLAVGMDKHFRALATKSGIGYDRAVKVSTTVSSWLASGVNSQITANKPKLVLISLGTNDSASSFTNEQHTAAITKLIAMIQATGAEIFWILPPKLPWAQTFSGLVRAQGVPVFESSTFDIPMGPDFIHPTGAGYAGWAGFVWKSITCGDKGAMPLSGAPPVVQQKLPQTSLVRHVKVNGVFTKRRRRA